MDHITFSLYRGVATVANIVLKNLNLWITSCLRIDSFRIGSFRIHLLPSRYCFLCFQFSSVTVSCSSVQLVEDDEKKRFEWPSNDSTMHPISPFRLRLYQQVIRRVVLWLVKYIDIQIDSLTVVVRDEQVGLSVGYHRIAQ